MRRRARTDANQREIPGEMVARFWPKVMKTPGCWLWTAATNRGDVGYGVLGISGTKNLALAHRISWVIHNGPIPPGMSVLHHCDVKWCIRPDHLYLGTYSDNIRDAWARIRIRGNALKGERHPLAKLTEPQVREIFCDTRPTAKIAQEYGVGVACIGAIKRRHNWKASTEGLVR